MKAISLTFHIAGVKYSDEAKLACVPPGTLVDVVHRPDNKFDAFALEASIRDVRIGHIPRTEQACWFYHIFHNVGVRCVVDAFDRNKPPYEQIQVHFECSNSYMTEVVKQGHPLAK